MGKKDKKKEKQKHTHLYRNRDFSNAVISPSQPKTTQIEAIQTPPNPKTPAHA
jgi:hypothetical protein